MSEEQNKYALLQTVSPPKPQREMTTWEERQAQKKAEEDAIRNRVRGARTDKAVFFCFLLGLPFFPSGHFTLRLGRRYRLK